jgi:hypothetical protein
MRPSLPLKLNPPTLSKTSIRQPLLPGIEAAESGTLVEMLWRAHLHFSVIPARARRHHRVTLEQVSNRCLFNVLPLGLCFFGASWGLVRVLHLLLLLPPRRSAACSEICMIFKAITVYLHQFFSHQHLFHF